MSGWASRAALAEAPQLVRSWRKNSIDAEATTVYGMIAASIVNPSAAPGSTYVNSTDSLTAFPDTTPQKWLTRAGGWVVNAAPGVIWVLDRLYGVSAIPLTATGDTSINTTTLPRYADGAGVMAFVMVATAATATNIVSCSLASYTNQDGTSGRVGTAMAFVNNAVDLGTVQGPMPLQGNDTGVRSVETFNVSVASTGTATAHLFLMRPLAMVPVEFSLPAEVDAADNLHLLTRIYDGASLTGLLLGYAGLEEPMGHVVVALDV